MHPWNCGETLPKSVQQSAAKIMVATKARVRLCERANRFIAPRSSDNALRYASDFVREIASIEQPMPLFSDSRLERNMVIGMSCGRCCAGCFRRCACTHLFCPFRILVVWILIRRNQVPTEMSEMTPAFENHPALKWLSFRGNDQAIVLPPCFPVRVSPVKFERL